jgi:hypothetical protein
MSRTTSIAGVRPLRLARARARPVPGVGVRSAVAWRGAAGLAPITLGMGARDVHARQRSGPGQGWCRRKSEIARARSWRQAEGWRAQPRTAQGALTSENENKTSPFWQLLNKCMSQISRRQSSAKVVCAH